jgi:hypothetical protein
MATTTFNDLITFSRGSNATVTGPNGLIQWAPSNLLLGSQDLESSNWFKGNTTVTANTTAAPDGTTTADTVAFAAVANANIQPNAAVTTTAGLVYTYSVYLRAASTVSNVRLSMQGSDTNTTITTDWQRFTMTVTASGATLAPTLVTRDSVAVSIQVWGAQFELGSTATTYNNTSVRNLLGFSEAFDNAAWTKTRASIVTGAQANPVNGLFNAQKLMEDTTASNSHAVSQSFTTIVGVPYTFSAYIKAAGRNFAAVYFSGPNRGIYVNLTTGAYAGDLIAAPTSYRIDAVGSGWFRVSITATATGTTTNAFIYTANSTPDYVYTGDGNSGVYIYGAMLSNSASLDPYVPTPGAAPSSTAYYGPRFDYDPVTLLPRGLLIEEQRVNSLTYSADFTNAAWTKSSCTVTANQGTAPDGTNTLTLLQFSAQFGRLQQGSLTSGTVYTFSIWCRVASGTRVYSLYDALGNPLGSFTATTTLTRYSVTFTAPATSTLYAVQDRNAGPFVDTFIWGAQLEAGAFATSYIPTIASTVTRSADVATITGSLFSQWYRQPEGTLIAEFSGPSGGYPVNMTDGTNNNATGLVYLTGTTLRGITVVSGSGRFVDMTASASPAINKTAYGYRLNDLGGSTNGGTVLTNTTAPIPTLDRMFIGTFSNFSYLNGHIRSIRYVPVRAADFQLQQVTT